MIQLNLLPEVKLEYIKAQKQRRLIFLVSAISAGLAIALLVSLFLIGSLQNKHLSDLDDDIRIKSGQLKGKKDIDRILTVQNQLNSLSGLHEAKPSAARLFTYVNQVTPAQVNIGDLKIDYLTQSASVTGTTDSLSSVNQYIDTLKFTNFTVEGVETPAGTPLPKAFSNVVMTSFTIDADSKNSPPAKYTVTFNYDPAIFDIKQNVNLMVPKTTTTRSAQQSPNDLFQALPEVSPNQPNTGN
jgi:hypothetical protein